jgi:hypothetical protein
VRHLDALCSHIQHAQDELGVILRHAHNRGNTGQLGHPDHLTYQLQVKDGMFHVDERPVKACHGNDFYYRRIGKAHMADQCQSAFTHDALDSVLAHSLPPLSEVGRGSHSPPPYQPPPRYWRL